MNIYELEKEATPSPWKYDEGDVKVPDEHGHSVCELYGTPRTIVANGRLIAHCRNNFIEALEALNEVKPPPVYVDYTCRRHATDCPCCDWQEKRDQLIAKLETVNQ